VGVGGGYRNESLSFSAGNYLLLGGDPAASTLRWEWVSNRKGSTLVPVRAKGK
jgi:hypothetical protein